MSVTENVARTIQTALSPISTGFQAAGLTQPWQRFLVGGGVGAAVVWYVKPEMQFVGDLPRPWSITSPVAGDDGIPPTIFPWWGTAIAVGFIASSFF